MDQLILEFHLLLKNMIAFVGFGAHQFNLFARLIELCLIGVDHLRVARTERFFGGSKILFKALGALGSLLQTGSHLANPRTVTLKANQASLQTVCLNKEFRVSLFELI